MINGIKRPMRKDFNSKGKLKQYLISLGVNTKINEDRFHQNENGKMVCDVVICFPDEFEKLTEEHQQFQSQIKTLKKSLEEKEKSLEIAENKLSNIEEEHKKEIKKLKKEYSDKIDELNDDFHEKDLEIERTKTKYEKEIGVFRESIQKEINNLELFDEDKHMLIKDHQAEVSGLKLFDDEYHMNITDHQKKISGIKDKIVRETIQYNDKISELEKSLRLSGYIRGHHKSKIKELKEGIDDFKLIAQYIESQENGILQDVKKGEGQD